jgi:hypothetical protein
LEQRRQGINKKLEEAARWWAGDRPAPAARLQHGTAVLDGLIADSAPDDVIEAVRARIEQAATPHEDTADAFEVFSENWDSVLFFLRVGTQWNAIGGMERVHWLGLDYAGVETRMPKSKKKRKKLWDDLQIMEATALEVLNRQKD